jgi:hypothetical protein
MVERNTDVHLGLVAERTSRMSAQVGHIGWPLAVIVANLYTPEAFAAGSGHPVGVQRDLAPPLRASRPRQRRRTASGTPSACGARRLTRAPLARLT